MKENNFNLECAFKDSCKKANGEECTPTCYPYVVLHGSRGSGGFYGSTGVPKRYKGLKLKDLPIKEENPDSYKVVNTYIKDLDKYVNDRSIGLFIYSAPYDGNAFGTGTGKTTTAAIILNEYVLHEVRKYLRGDVRFSSSPGIFVMASDFQNTYNEQFRGSNELREDASNRFYALKKRMKSVNLLVVDDIAMRDTTEAFKSELYEVIDYRANNEKTTIFTSNYPIDRLADLLGDRIASRIDGMTYKVKITGKDHRKGGQFR